jgi:Tol biopolymer transport system component
MRLYSPLSAWALSANGTLVYVKGDETLASSLHFVWVDREGNPQRMSGFAAPVTAFALSPDETKVAYVVGEEWVAGSLSVLDLARQVPTPVASQVMSLTAGVWAPDGGSIYITDGMGSVQRVFPGTGRAPEQVGSPGILVTDIFDDQQRLVGLDVGSGFSPSGVLLSDVDGGPEAQPQVIEVQRSQYTGLLSEDEDWLLVSAFGGDRTEVWVVRLSGQEARYPVSLSGGSHPRWSPDGDEIFYMDGSDVMAASFDPTADPPLGRPVRLFDASGRYRWRVSPIQGSASVFWPTADGGFLMLTGDEGTAETSEPRVILEKGFFEVLRERLPR